LRKGEKQGGGGGGRSRAKKSLLDFLGKKTETTRRGGQKLERGKKFGFILVSTKNLLGKRVETGGERWTHNQFPSRKKTHSNPNARSGKTRWSQKKGGYVDQRSARKTNPTRGEGQRRIGNAGKEFIRLRGEKLDQR